MDLIDVLEAVGECTTLAGYGAPGRDRMTAASGATIGNWSQAKSQAVSGTGHRCRNR
jgi:hypothetical protein